MSSALLLCDLWDDHWCATAAAGTARIARRAAVLVSRFRSQGGTVIHAPSETMPFYADHPARRYVLDLRRSSAPAPRANAGDPPRFPPVSAQCSDTPPCREPVGPPWPWTRQHPAIEVTGGDAVLDGARELFAVIADRDTDHVFVAGVHTNRCVVDRPFGIKALVRAGIACSLVGDLTEAIPAEYTPTAIEHVAQHWCPVVPSQEVRS